MPSTSRNNYEKTQSKNAPQSTELGRLARNPKSRPGSPLVDRVRYQIAILMIMLLMLIALLAAVQTGALSVLQLLLPLIGTIFGFFFGYKVGKM